MKIATFAVFAIATMLSGCASVTPTSIVDSPRTARPLTTEQMQVKPTSGAIYQGGNFRPIFEDRRARQVGDVLTLVITCLLYTSPSPRDLSTSRMPSSA